MFLFYRPQYVLLLAKNIKTPSGSFSILIDQSKNRDITIIKRFIFFYDYDEIYDEIIRDLTRHRWGNKFIIIGNNCYSKKAKLFFGFDRLFSTNQSSYILSMIHYDYEFSLNYRAISFRSHMLLIENNVEIKKSLFDGVGYRTRKANILKKYFINYKIYLTHVYNEALKQGYNLLVYKKKNDKFFIDHDKKYVKDFLCSTHNENSWNDFYIKDNIEFSGLMLNYVVFITQSRIVSSVFTVNTILYQTQTNRRILPLDFLNLYVLEKENKKSIIVIDRLDKNYFKSKLKEETSIIQDKDFISMNILKNIQLFTSETEGKGIQIVENSFTDKSEWTYVYLSNKNKQESFSKETSKEIVLNFYLLTKTNIIVYSVKHKSYQKFDTLYLEASVNVETLQKKYRAGHYLPDVIYTLNDIQCAGISVLFLVFILGDSLINKFNKLINKYIYNNKNLNIKKHFKEKGLYILTSPFYGPFRIVFDLTGLYISLSELIESSKHVVEIERDGNSYYLFSLDISGYGHRVKISKSGFKGNNNEESKLLLEFIKSHTISINIRRRIEHFSISIFSKSKYKIGKLLKLIDDNTDIFKLKVSFFISKNEWLQVKEKCESIYLKSIEGVFYISNENEYVWASLDDSARKIRGMRIMCDYGEHKVHFREAATL